MESAMEPWLDHVNRSKKVSTHGALKASYIVLHNTLGGAVTGSIDYLNERTNGYGYHVLIERDGTVYQTAPLNQITRHAGLSNWRGWDILKRLFNRCELRQLRTASTQGIRL